MTYLNNEEKLEVLRLQKKFSNLDNITYLKDLVHGVDCCSPEKPIAYQWDHNLIKVFEEHDISGTIPTDIIPITYHSSYANAIALQLKKTLENHSDFFRVFLEDYNEIIIDKNQESCEGILVFRNYLRCVPGGFGLPLEDTIKGILSDKYTLNDDEYSSLTIHFSLKKVKKDFDYSSLLQIPDFGYLFSLLLDSNQYQELRLLLNQQESVDTYLEEFKKRHVFDIMNQEVDIFYHHFGITDFELINDALEYARNNIKLYERDLSGFQQVSRDLMIDLTLKFLDTIDDTHALSKEFQETLNEKKTVLWYPWEKEQVEKFYKQQNYDYKNINESYYSPYYDRINIPLTGTVQDVIGTVHEFMHRHSLHKSSTRKSGLLKEIICIYFETKAAYWLVEQGYKEEECFEGLTHRQAIDPWNNIGSGTTLVFDLVKRKQQYGTLTVDNFADEESLGLHLLMYWMLNHPGERLNPEQKGCILSNEEFTAAINEKAMNNVNVLLNANPVKVTNYLSYTLGTYLADKSISSDMDARMMFVADNLSNPEYSDIDLFKHIQEEYCFTSSVTKEKIKKN